MSERSPINISRVVISPKSTISEIGIPSLQKITAGKTQFLLALDENGKSEIIGEVDLSGTQAIQLYHSPTWYAKLSKSLRLLSLIEELQVHLTEFVRCSGEVCKQNSIDCLSFFLFLNGHYDWHKERKASVVREFLYFPVPFPTGEEPMGTGFLITEISEKGEIFTSDDFHVAIALGKDLYLSKLGFEGPIVVTSWKELRKLYPFKVVAIIKKKSDLENQES